MNIYVERSDERHTFTFEGVVQELLDKLDINAQTVLVLKNDELVTEDEALVDSDEVKIITVVSGG